MFLFIYLFFLMLVCVLLGMQYQEYLTAKKQNKLLEKSFVDTPTALLAFLSLYLIILLLI